jgi:hypothetical protein
LTRALEIAQQGSPGNAGAVAQLQAERHSPPPTKPHRGR